MKTIYEKPVRQLLAEYITSLNLAPDQIVDRSEIINWFKQRYPKIKSPTVGCHIIRFATNAPERVHFRPNRGQDDVLYRVERGRYRLYAPTTDPAPIYVKLSAETSETKNVQAPNEAAAQEFAYEQDLQQFLAKNLELVEPGLRLYEDEEDDTITGLEFDAGERFIDILAVDKSNNYVVIELKVSRGYDRTVGQILRYMGWIKKELAQENQKVRGIIIAREISDDLKLATSALPNVTLFEYELKVSLRMIKNDA